MPQPIEVENERVNVSSQREIVAPLTQTFLLTLATGYLTQSHTHGKYS